MTNTVYTPSEMAVGANLPNGYAILAYFVLGTGGIVLGLSPCKRKFASWKFNDNDLRTTYDGHYFEHTPDEQTNPEIGDLVWTNAFRDMQDRIADFLPDF